MNTKRPTIWMNVTTSANWQRPAVGIVRVEQCIARELAKIHGEQFKLCIWADDAFARYSGDIHSLQSAAKVPAPENIPAPSGQLPWLFPLLSRRKSLVAIAQAALSLTPGIARPLVNRFLYFARNQTLHLLNSRLANKLRSSRLHKRQQLQVVEQVRQQTRQPDSIFAPGDILISLGLDWDSGVYHAFYKTRKNQQIKIITCCYDLIPVFYPQYCVGNVASLFMGYFIDLAEASDVILCISQQSQTDLNTLLHRVGAATPQTLVFPLGDNVPASTEAPLSESVSSVIQQPFILFVSTIERRKNHEVLYRAYHLLCKQGKTGLPKLVFVGMQGWGVNDLMQDIQLDPVTADHICMLNQVTDSELAALYQSALFCVFPSLYEGWGLPVGEALAMGKAVIASSRGSLPEVGGELVTYLDPWDPNAWAQEIYRMSTDHDYRQQLEATIKRDYHARTWTDGARKISQAIEQLMIAGPQSKQPTEQRHE